MPDHHEIYSPSSADRWRKGGCHDSVNAPADPGSAESREGDVAHDFAYKLLTGQEVGKFPSAEMRKAVMRYVEYVQDLPGSETVQCEVFLKSKLIRHHGGWTDSLIILPNEIHVPDFKYGMMPVPAAGNDQLLAYLGLADEHYPGRTRFFGHLIQPRVKGPECHEFTMEDIIDFRADALMAVGSTHRQAGGHCQWCPWLLDCETRRKWMYETADFLFDDDPSHEELQNILAARKVIETLADKAKTRLLERAMQGDVPTGHKLVWDLTDRTIRNQDEAAAKLREAGLTEDQIWQPQRMRSPNQLEEFVDKDVIAQLSERYRKGPKIAPLSSRLPDYNEISADVFEDSHNEVPNG